MRAPLTCFRDENNVWDLCIFKIKAGVFRPCMSSPWGTYLSGDWQTTALLQGGTKIPNTNMTIPNTVGWGGQTIVSCMLGYNRPVHTRQISEKPLTQGWQRVKIKQHFTLGNFQPCINPEIGFILGWTQPCSTPRLTFSTQVEIVPRQDKLSLHKTIVK